MSEEEPRFVDKGDGTIKDNMTTLLWAKEDSWQTEEKWVTWDEALQHAQDLSNAKFAGYNDWRLPTLEELLSLVATEVGGKDKYGKELLLDPIFPSEGLSTHWSHEGVGQDGYTVNFNTGEKNLLYKSKSGRMATRPVRGTPVGLD